MRRFVAALLALIPSPALAWWDYGHQTIARIAWAEVRPATRARMQALLAQSHLLETPNCPARTIEDASIWADCVKSGERFSYAFPWHFQNIDICKPFDLKAACAYGNCVSAQVTRAAKLLADGAIPKRERVQSLVLLIHFAGDLHQPLHAADRADSGGTRTRTHYGEAGPYSLHVIWDGYLAERAISTPPADAAGLLGEATNEARAAAAAGTVEDWSRETWQVTRDVTYGVDGNPCVEPRQPVVLDQSRIEAAIPAVRRQLLRGGLRLARLLDEALASATER